MLSRQRLKALFFLSAAASLIAILVFGPVKLPTLNYLQEHLREYQDIYRDNPIPTYLTYFLIYVLATSFSIPGALLLTLLAGALFGLWPGFFLVSIAATIGASLSFLLSRYLLSGFIRARFGRAFMVIDQGIERSGKFYLMSIRISPIFPYFIVNLVMGLTKMPLREFIGASYLGMIIPSLIYVNAGGELVKIHSLSDVLSPKLVFSLTLLALLPLFGKWVSARLIRK